MMLFKFLSEQPNVGNNYQSHIGDFVTDGP